VLHHVLPLMLAEGRGAITNVSSTDSIRHSGYVYPAYNTSKAGLDQLTISLALTYANRASGPTRSCPGSSRRR
jgi:NAD(P)-dependent dehydrogenase (short-subunit alcohol dehydrogenase family)